MAVVHRCCTHLDEPGGSFQPAWFYERQHLLRHRAGKPSSQPLPQLAAALPSLPGEVSKQLPGEQRIPAGPTWAVAVICGAPQPLSLSLHAHPCLPSLHLPQQHTRLPCHQVLLLLSCNANQLRQARSQTKPYTFLVGLPPHCQNPQTLYLLQKSHSTTHFSSSKL